jgi:hypothetical protein
VHVARKLVFPQTARVPILPWGASQSTERGAIINLKLNHLPLAGLLILPMLFTAVFCAAQTSSQPQTPDANQSAQPAATSTSQTPAPTPPSVPAQTPNDQTPTPSQDKNNQDKNNKDKNKDKDNPEPATSGTSKDRLFFALPNFLTVDANGKIIPLTAGQKFKVVAQGSFDPVQIVWYAALSGISQAEDSEPGYGQGWAAYGKRYGAYAADGTIENFFVGAILPSVLHQDPRFFPKPQGSFVSRAEYAVSRIVVTRGDSGNRQFNYSEIFGSAIASAISTYSYHPRRTFIRKESDGTLEYAPSDRTLKNTASVWGSQVGYDTITLVVKEFWPDIRRKLKKQPH